MKKIILLLAILAVSFATMAQGKVTTVYLGYALEGDVSVQTHSQGNTLNFYRWDGDVQGFKIALDRKASSNYSLLHELSYFSLDMMREDNHQSYNASLFSYNLYGGVDLLASYRIQIPCYLGIGVTYRYAPLDSDNFPSNIKIAFSFAMRPKVYITNNMAVYAGYTTLFGGGSKNDDDNDETNSSSFKFSHFEVGMAFSF